MHCSSICCSTDCRYRMMSSYLCSWNSSITWIYFTPVVVTAPVSVTTTCCRYQRWDSRFTAFITALPKGRSFYLCSWNITSSWIYFTPVLLLLQYLLQLPAVATDVETPGVEESGKPIDGLNHCYWPSLCRCQSRSLLPRPPKIVPSSGYLHPSAAAAKESVEQPAVSFDVVVPAVSTSGSVQHIILPQTSRAVHLPA
jgi:hypothetical protein